MRALRGWFSIHLFVAVISAGAVMWLVTGALPVWSPGVSITGRSLRPADHSAVSTAEGATFGADAQAAEEFRAVDGPPGEPPIASVSATDGPAMSTADRPIEESGLRGLRPLPSSSSAVPSPGLLDSGVLSSADLSVLLIERTPRRSWVEIDASPSVGDVVTFTAKIANVGASVSGAFRFRWDVDGREVAHGQHAGLAPDQRADLHLPWRWTEERALLTFAIEPLRSATPTSRTENDVLTIATDSLALGVWVEESFFDHAANAVPAAGWGGATFEDWMQRQVGVWNQMLAQGIHPLAPEGILDRIRLDRVVVVPDGSLGCRVEEPVKDYEQDLIWGFPAAWVGAGAGTCDLPPLYRDDITLWDRDMTLLHELSHARYLADTYGLNVRSMELTLMDDVDRSADRLPVALIPALEALAPPVSLVLGGEIVRCASREGDVFTDCARGQFGTRVRVHTAGTPVYGGGVLLTDGAGNALAGGASMPARSDHFHLGPDYGSDLMNYGTGYGEHSAWAWNRIAGLRPTCGNANPPCNIGDYLFQMPERTNLRLTFADGRPAAGAEVAIYRPSPAPGWYGRRFGPEPDQVVFADGSGTISLGAAPFGGQAMVHGEGFSNLVLALRVRAGDRLAATFIDASAFNLARAREGRQEATIDVSLDHWEARTGIRAAR